MQALIKNDKKIIINQIDYSEQALIDDFIRLAIISKSSIKSLYDIDNDFDGIGIELINDGSKDIPFRMPGIQIVVPDEVYTIDLRTDEDTLVELISAPEDYITVSIQGSIITYEASFIEELSNKSKQYSIIVKLSKEGYEPVILPIDISVLYFKIVTDYEELDNLPKIENKTLKGNMSYDFLGIQEEMDPITNHQIDNLFN